MLINASAAEEVRMAMVEDGVLTDLDVETASKEKSRGNIYKGIVANVEASLGAAFIEFGHAKQGFLAFDDLRPELWDPSWQGEGRPRITDVLHRKQEIIVQVIKEEMGNKGAAVTTYLSLPGRFVVLMHSGGGRGGVSRKIDDERERAKAKEQLDKLKVPDDLGVIIRTAGMGKNRAELQQDLNNLSRNWGKIMETAAIARAPSLLYREPDLVVRTIRDYLTPDVDEVLIDDPDEFDEAVEYFSQGEEEAAPPVEGAPPAEEKKGQDLIKLYEGNVPLFDKYNVEDQLEALYKRNVPLPSGGYLIIDQTEALVSIDVNSGKSTREDDHESTVYKTNLEAVAEVARQLRLRDMGGIVVVDLIDMASRKHERDVENRLKEVIKSDKARIKLGRISENGLLELTRQRLRQAHRLVSHVPCTTCGGTGVVRAIPGQAVAALRELQTRAAAGANQLSRLAVRLPLDAANHLANAKRLELDALAKQWDLKVEVLADPTVSSGDSKFEEERRGRAALAAPSLPTVKDKDEEWRGRRRGRREAAGPEVPVAAPQTIEDRQEAQFEADRGKQRPGGREGGRGRWERGGRGERPGRGDRPGRAAPVEQRSEQKQAENAQAAADGRPQLVAEDIRGAPPPRHGVTQPQRPPHFPDDALMEALYGDPPELVLEASPPPVAASAMSIPVTNADGTVVAMAVPVEAAAAAPGAVAAPGTQVSGAPVTGALGEDGLPRKKRRRRRRRRRGAGAPVIDPLTGLPVPQQPGQPGVAPVQGHDDGDDDEGDDEGEEDEQTQRMDVAPAPSTPAQDQQGLVQAATHAILGTTPPPSDVVTVEVQPPTEILDAADVAAHLDALDEADEDEDDDEEADEELAPLPPPGPPSGEGTASPEEPTVLAKRASRRPAPRGKPRAAAGAKGKKKAAVKKKAKPRS